MNSIVKRILFVFLTLVIVGSTGGMAFLMGFCDDHAPDRPLAIDRRWAWSWSWNHCDISCCTYYLAEWEEGAPVAADEPALCALRGPSCSFDRSWFLLDTVDATAMRYSDPKKASFGDSFRDIFVGTRYEILQTIPNITTFPPIPDRRYLLRIVRRTLFHR